MSTTNTGDRTSGTDLDATTSTINTVLALVLLAVGDIFFASDEDAREFLNQLFSFEVELEETAIFMFEESGERFAIFIKKWSAGWEVSLTN